jgi:hypothetical protein
LRRANSPKAASSGTRRQTHLALAIALTGQPGHVLLDLRADPRAPDPVDGVRLDEILLQHGNFLSAHELEEAASPRNKRYVNRTSTGTTIAPAIQAILINLVT